MNSIAKRVSYLLSLVLILVSFPLPTYAKGESKLEAYASDLMVSFLRADYEGPLDFETVSLGDPIPIFEYNHKDKHLKKFTQASYYPVYIDGKIEAIFSTHGNGSDITYCISQSWAKELNEFISNGNSQYCLIVTEECTMLKSTEEIVLVEENKVITSQSKTGPNVDDIVAEVDQLQKDMASKLEYHKNKPSVELAIPAISFDSSVIQPERNIRKGEFKQASGDAKVAATSEEWYFIWYYLDYPYEYKQQYGECWAVGVWYLGEWYRDLGYWDDDFDWDTLYSSPLKICDALGIPYSAGGSINDMRYALSQLYGVANNFVYSAFTNSQIVTCLEQRERLFMADFQGNNYGHILTGCGVEYTENASKVKVRLFDSNDAKYKILMKSGGVYKYTYGSKVATWAATIYPSN